MIQEHSKKELDDSISRVSNLEMNLCHQLRGPITDADLRVLECVREALTQLRMARVNVK
jgi:hypothetical protein